MNENNNTEPVVYAVGTRGYSAYEVAVQEGFVGTEQEWLDSLVGPQGPQGQPFDELTPEQKEEIRGPQGKSAYEVAVDEGFEGTEEDFVDSYLNASKYYNKTEINAKEETLQNSIQQVSNELSQDLETEIENRTLNDTNLQNQISSLANGSPIPVSSVSDMTDTSKAYVNTTDGKWYYYDGDSWEIGGTYQGVLPSANSIGFDNFKSDVSDRFEKINNIGNNPRITNILTIPNETSITANMEWGMYFKQDTYLISYKPDFSVSTGTFTWKLYETENPIANNENLTLIDSGTLKKGEAIVLNRVMTNKLFLTIDSDNAGYLGFTRSEANYDRIVGIARNNNNKIASCDVEVLHFGGTYIYGSLKVEDYINNQHIYDFIKPSINLFNKNATDVEYNCYYDGQNTKVASDRHNESGYIEVLPNSYISVKNHSSILAYDENKNFISYIKIASNNTWYSGLTPNNCKYIRCAVLKSDFNIYMVINGLSYPESYIPYGCTGSIDYNNPFKNKKCIQLGDSITWYDGHVGAGTQEIIKGYASYLRELGLTVTNEAVSGACVAYHSESNYEDISETVDDIDFEDYDLVTIAGGINDYAFWNSNLGSIINGKTGFDRTTFYGGLQYILDKILRDNPNIKILLFTPLKYSGKNYGLTPNSANLKLIDYVNAIKEIAALYSIPVFDLYEVGEFNRYTIEGFTLDGLHPNNLGFEHISNKLKSKVIEL